MTAQAPTGFLGSTPIDSRFRSVYITWAGGEFHFDAVLSEKHSITSTVTEHAVEEGSNIADHVRPDPIEITIQGVVSNQPVVPPGVNGWTRSGQTLQLYSDAHKPQPKDPPGTPPPEVVPPSPPLYAVLSLNGVINVGLSALNNGGSFTVLQSPDRNVLPDQNATFIVDTLDSPTNFIANALSALTQLRDEATLCTVIAPHKGPYNNLVLTKIGFSRAPSQAGLGTFDLELKEIRIVQSAVVAAPQPSIVQATPAVKAGNQAPEPPKKVKSIAKAALDKARANVAAVK